MRKRRSSQAVMAEAPLLAFHPEATKDTKKKTILRVLHLFGVLNYINVM
jgi:hypothetical protein